METLRRLPWTEEGRAVYVPPGDGFVNDLVDAMEGEMLGMARADASRGRALADDPAAYGVELRRAVWYLARAVEDAALVADLRAERLPGVADE
ncbi:hypothetical protein [Streptomyces sp. CA-132043]|uniref:hypothetical protein n=1 Tax=Streptomyces sp. CA-132043 TaxID=3240048 RepID=UPI003D914E33